MTIEKKINNKDNSTQKYISEKVILN